MTKPIDVSKIERVFIRGLNWRLGDSLMTTPFIAAVRELFPRARIDLAVPERVRRVFEGNPAITNIIPFDTSHEYKSLSAKMRFARELAGQKYDVAFLLQRAIEAALLTAYAKIPVRIGYDSDMRGFLLTHTVSEKDWSLTKASLHQVDYYLRILKKYFTLPRDDYSLAIYPLERDRAATHAKVLAQGIDIAKDRFVVFSPGTSYGVAKKWDIDRWNELAVRITREYPGMKVLLTGSDYDMEYCSAMPLGNGVCSVVGATEIGELIHVLAASRCVVTIDNGNAHLAAALQKPLVVLFGSSNPVTTAPYRRNEDVIYKKIYCSPCCDKICREKHHRCMKEISVDEVLAMIGQRLK
ncbi:MAG: lipopolysaccharide heptosyltransferase II [Spirochaetes bacterium]|nr:lipopolysaccharide heptosyltransferase II [Spirochaetota bacterium]